MKTGDLVKLDFGVSFRGWFGDSARTVPVGAVSEEATKLITVTREALHRAIATTTAEHRLGDLGHAIQQYAQSHGFSVVRDFMGHGIGRSLHEKPSIPNFGAANTGLRLKPGTTLAIEPMVNVGTDKVEVLDDDWTAVTLDRKLSAHFEHTVHVSENGPEILTLPG